MPVKQLKKKIHTVFWNNEAAFQPDDPWVFRRFQWEWQTFLTACLNIMLDTDGRDKGQTAGEGLNKKQKLK